METQAIIFDMDGLMLDTEPLYRIVWKQAAADCGYNLTDEIYRGLVGRGRKVAEQILAQTFGPEFPMEQFHTLSREHELKMFTSGPIEKKPGLDELLSYVESRSLPKAVATSTERQIALPLLARMGLLQRFDVVATGDEVPNGKPQPDLFLLAAQRFAIEPSRCLVLEDSEAGVMAAARAGMPVYLVPDLVKPSPEVERLASGVFNSLSDVTTNLRTASFGSQYDNHRLTSIKTERLIAFPLCEPDSSDIRVMHQDREVMATLGGIRSEEESDRWFRDNLEHWTRNSFGIWVFRDHCTGQFVGRGGIRRVEVDGGSEVELGYALSSKYWNMGLASEMAKAILTYSADRLNLKDVVALIAESNAKSRRVAMKCYFRFERNVVWKNEPVMLYRAAGHLRL